MSDYILECLGLALRWLHLVAAIAWIGESFYFVMLDRSLKPAAHAPAGVAGELWSVHGGGFYHKQKYLTAPAHMPEDLHWSKWKAYTTWLSGFALFVLLYLLAPKLYLIDPAVAALDPTSAIILALAFPIAAWIGYDLLCRLVGFRDGLLGALVGALTIGLCYAATQLFAGRAAFLLVGAALGTIMAANVFFVIIPGQKRMVAALARGEKPDPLPGLRGKQRSVHNTYFTLPVVFAMLSNHYATAYAHPHNWLVLALFMAAGALIRQFFVLWHSGGRAWGLLAAGMMVLIGTFVWLAPPTPSPTSNPAQPTSSSESALTPELGAFSNPHVEIAEVDGILKRHCTACHSAHPSLMTTAPKGVMFDDVSEIERYADLIQRQAVVLKIMPPGNITGISEVERESIARWYASRSATIESSN